MSQYKLMDESGKFYYSSEPGLLGGYRRKKIYGRLDCKSANRAIAKGGYVEHRVFFKDEARPQSQALCGVAVLLAVGNKSTVLKFGHS